MVAVMVAIMGEAGTVTEVIGGRRVRRKWPATVSTWFCHCPGQSPAWSDYLLCVVHLRDWDGGPTAEITVPGATHELFVAALDPFADPLPSKINTWRVLYPLNVSEQVQLPDDDSAKDLGLYAATAIAAGRLPAEPALSGAVEPWRTALIKTSAHLRGEVHAP